MTTKKKRRGRPTRAQQSKLALAGINVDLVDPIRVLREVAADSSQPGTSRVAAARALLGLADELLPPAIIESDDGLLSKRAIELMRRRAN